MKLDEVVTEVSLVKLDFSALWWSLGSFLSVVWRKEFKHKEQYNMFGKMPKAGKSLGLCIHLRQNCF